MLQSLTREAIKLAKQFDDISPMIPWSIQKGFGKVNYVFIKAGSDWRVSLIEDNSYLKFLGACRTFNNQGSKKINFQDRKLGFEHPFCEYISRIVLFSVFVLNQADFSHF